MSWLMVSVYFNFNFKKITSNKNQYFQNLMKQKTIISLNIFFIYKK